MSGDFNLVLDARKGSLNRANPTGEKDLAIFIKEAMAHRSLLEVDSKDNQRNLFTWRRGNCHSKLDYVFTSPLLKANVTKAKIKWHEFGAKYDHAGLEVSFASTTLPDRGRSFPKLFKTDIASERDRLWLGEQLEAFGQQIPPHWNPHMRLDFIKSMLRLKSLEIRKMNKLISSSEVIRDQINSIASRLNPTVADINCLEELKRELAQAEEREAETLRIKAGVKWREQGERSTKYFMNRFKARTAATAMHALNIGRQVITGSADLVAFVKIFYSRLYGGNFPDKANDESFSDEFFSRCPKMDNDLRQFLAQPLSLDELKVALQSCQDSAPGMDGIPYSFYKAFPDFLLELLLNSWRFALESGELASSHRRSCLTLLPKKGKDLSQIGNWRPTSLSACDLKIVTKAYANRLKQVLPSILSDSQAAYIPGRDISFNNRILMAAKAYAIEHNEDFCIVSLDAKKAFDSVSHCYLVKVLKAYDFPVEFINVFKTLYSNLDSVVQVNGHLSDPFPVKNGVKQGDA